MKEKTDYEYAALIYCRVFNVSGIKSDDCTDADTQRILDAVNKLSPKEQIALNCYYKQNYTYKQTGILMGNLSGETARITVQKALLKLRHPSRSQGMKISNSRN